MLIEDSFIRMINIMLAVIGKIFGLRIAGQFTEAAIMIQSELEKLFKLDHAIIDEMDDQDLLALLEKEDELDVPNVLFAGDIYFEKTKLYLEWNSPELAMKSAMRALLFYTEAAIAGIPPELSNPGEKIEEIIRFCQEMKYALPDHLLAGLYQYYEGIGEYRKSEQYLLELSNLPEWRTETPAERKSFYDRLLMKSDENLEAGGINRNYLLAQIKTL